VYSIVEEMYLSRSIHLFRFLHEIVERDKLDAGVDADDDVVGLPSGLADGMTPCRRLERSAPVRALLGLRRPEAAGGSRAVRRGRMLRES
jgi:hypothetical protein